MDNFKKRRNALETLAKQGMLNCIKHNSEITTGRMFKSHCYIGRRKLNKCPYLQFKGYEPDEGCNDR